MSRQVSPPLPVEGKRSFKNSSSSPREDI